MNKWTLMNEAELKANIAMTAMKSLNTIVWEFAPAEGEPDDSRIHQVEGLTLLVEDLFKEIDEGKEDADAAT